MIEESGPPPRGGATKHLLQEIEMEFPGCPDGPQHHSCTAHHHYEQRAKAEGKVDGQVEGRVGLPADLLSRCRPITPHLPDIKASSRMFGYAGLPRMSIRGFRDTNLVHRRCRRF